MANVTFETARFKQDNTQVVDYLISTASALSSAGIIDEKDGDNLRLVISSLQAKRDRQPILLEMIEQGVEFLDILEARYGTVGQSMNLLRHSSRPYLAQLLKVLATWGDATL